jgi:hypothetical protein
MVVLGEDPQRPRLMIGREPDPDRPNALVYWPAR